MFLPYLKPRTLCLWVKHCTRDVYLTITELPHVISFLVRFDLAILSFHLCKKLLMFLLFSPCFPKSLVFFCVPIVTDIKWEMMRRKQLQKCLKCLFPMQVFDMSVLALFLAQTVLWQDSLFICICCHCCDFSFDFCFHPKWQVAVVHCMQFLEFGRREVPQGQGLLLIFALFSAFAFVFLICKLLISS